MKKKLSTLFIFSICLFFSIETFSQVVKDNTNSDKKYQKEWKTVDSLDSKGLPKSALEVVEKIYKMAKVDNNNDQILKAIMYRMKYLAAPQDEEDIYGRLLADIDSEIVESSLPNRHILHSMKAEMYWMFYQNNQYQILERTNTIGYKSDDINTWTLDQLIDKVIEHYLLSLSNKDSLFSIDMNMYDDIISLGYDARRIRPTLYDFLASRAYLFFSATELTLSRPADFFQLKEDFYFAPVEEFVKSKVSSSDSLSLHYQAIVILKDWLSRRLKDNNTEALVDLDLNRLSFVYQKSVNPNKEKLYLEALQKMQSKYAGSKEYSEIGYYIASYYYTRSNTYNSEDELSFQFKGDKVKAVEICDLCIEKYPDSYGAGMCKSLKNTILSKALSFKVENVIGPNAKFPIQISYQNITKAYAMVGSIQPEKLIQLSEKYYGEKYYEQLLKTVKPLKNYSFNLKGIEDFNAHSTEAVIEGLPIGTYVVFVANNDKFSYENNVSNYAVLTVTGISFTERTLDNGSIEYLVLDRNSGFPLKDVTVKATYQEYDYKLRKYKTIVYGTYLTNTDGKCVINASADKSSRSIDVEFINGPDYYNPSRNAYIYYRDYTPTVQTKVFLFSDRAIYRPGQTVYYKGIMLNYNGEKSEVAANQTAVVMLYDVNYQKVAEQTHTTNEFGSFNGTFTIPKGLINGQMQLYTYTGSLYFSVEEYKRPKFQVEVQPFKGNYVLNDSVKVSGKAVSFAGSAISDAKVKYRILRKPVWRGWWYYYMPTVEYQMAEGTVISNDKGEFDIKFVALPDLSKQKNKYLFFEYQVIIDVTDLNGETQSTQKSMLVGTTALQVSLSLDELVQIEKVGKTGINTQNINGDFLEAKGEIKISKLKNIDYALRERPWIKPDEFIYSSEEWKNLFPGNVYKNENDLRKREIDRQMLSKTFNTAESKEVDLSEMKNWEPGIYVAETSSVDAFGNAVEWKNYFTLYKTANGQMPDKMIQWFVPVNSVVEVGDKAQILFGSSLPGVKVLYEVENKGKIIEKKWLNPEGNQQLIEIPVVEDYKGNFSVYFTFIKDNRLYQHTQTIYVPRTEKVLDISFETFRDKLFPGQEEEWKIKIKGKNGDKVAAELLATLYDASLDKFVANNWNFSVYNSYYSTLGWKTSSFGVINGTPISQNLNDYIYMPYKSFDQLNWFGFNYYSYRFYRDDFLYAEESEKSISDEDVAYDEGPKVKKNGGRRAENAPVVSASNGNGDKEVLYDLVNEVSTGDVGGLMPVKPKETDFSNVQIRSNFNETAFFYPELRTNEEGEVIVKFKIPESLTTWKMMGFAHTKDIKYGSITNELKTQKDLMVVPNDPRFFRQNDKIVFPVKISNLSKSKLSGTARLELFDAITMKPIEGIFDKKETADKNFDVDAEGNIVVKWKLNIPDYISAVSYKVMAKSGNFSDGEQKPVPVLTNRMLVTESLPLPIRGNQTKDYELTKLVDSKKSNSLKNFKLTLEFSSNPAWYAIQALPYIMEYPYECYEQTFSRLYANTIASYVANSSPKVKAVFDSWKDTEGSESFLSNLEKNQELKSVLLEETPWVLEANDEQERKKRVGLLFDLNRMADELGRATQKMVKGQTYNGGWPWFDGMPESRYITQHIVNGMGHLDKLGIKTVREDGQIWNMLQKAVGYLDQEIVNEYNDLLRWVKKEDLEKNHLSYTAVHYLYGRSFFKDIEIPKRTKEAYDYYMKQSEKYWLSWDLYSRGMMALYLDRYDKKQVAKDIVKSLKELSTESDEMGMYWKSNMGGYYWYQAPIETQAILIEVFNEVAKSQADVEALKVWLLKQKQTQDWKTTKATVEAIYALLLTGQDWLASDKLVKIKLGDQEINPSEMDNVKIEAGTGYFKTSWSGSEIKPEMGKVHLEKSDPGVAWGGLYWQYFEDLDKITPHETPLKLNKKLFVERISSKGKAIEAIDKKTKLIIGDKVIIRIELRVDRDMEYVHMKDMRASGFEPINVFSQYKWQDGLGYYESTKDAATNFFMYWLPKGTYVFEYPLRVTHEGDFSNGVTTIQCMYAPEFTSHSEGVRVNVED
jgi:uncharacterized protein YfaS (alpha-2-macroglobulin family)